MWVISLMPKERNQTKKEYILKCSIYIKFRKIQTIVIKSRSVVACIRGGEGQEGRDGKFGGPMDMFIILIVVMVSRVCTRQSFSGKDLDGRGVRRRTHLLPQTHQKSTSTCRVIRTEHLLNAGRRTSTSKKVKKLSI